jgi:hypothetical protein
VLEVTVRDLECDGRRVRDGLGALPASFDLARRERTTVVAQLVAVVAAFGAGLEAIATHHGDRRIRADGDGGLNLTGRATAIPSDGVAVVAAFTRFSGRQRIDSVAVAANGGGAGIVDAAGPAGVARLEPTADAGGGIWRIALLVALQNAITANRGAREPGSHALVA